MCYFFYLQFACRARAPSPLTHEISLTFFHNTLCPPHRSLDGMWMGSTGLIDGLVVFLKNLLVETFMYIYAYVNLALHNR
jgi:hypothetical protein